jgi:hypothetical protein
VREPPSFAANQAPPEELDEPALGIGASIVRFVMIAVVSCAIVLLLLLLARSFF